MDAERNPHARAFVTRNTCLACHQTECDVGTANNVLTFLYCFLFFYSHSRGKRWSASGSSVSKVALAKWVTDLKLPETIRWRVQ